MMSDGVGARGAPRTLGFFGTLGFALLIYAAYVVSGWLTALVLYVASDVPAAASHAELSRHHYWESAVLLGAYPCGLAALWFAIRNARRQFSEYLAFIWPEPRELVLALIVMFVVLQVLGFLAGAIGEPADAGSIAAYRGATDGGSLFLFLATTCLGAPIFEELVVRGFMFRGWSESFVRPEGAIVLSSLSWAALHIQYDWFSRSEIFVMGLVLGYFRNRSGSTLLAVVVHSAVSLYVMLGLALTT